MPVSFGGLWLRPNREVHIILLLHTYIRLLSASTENIFEHRQVTLQIARVFCCICNLGNLPASAAAIPIPHFWHKSHILFPHSGKPRFPPIHFNLWDQPEFTSRLLYIQPLCSGTSAAKRAACWSVLTPSNELLSSS